MTLRRTGIQRRKELARTAALSRTPLARRKPLRAKQVRASSVRRNTGPGPKQRNLVVERAQGCCELCSVQLHDGVEWIRDHSFHHRRPRRAGGSRLASTNAPSNILLLCGSGTTGCHGQVETNRKRALAHGWLLHAQQDPTSVPVDIGPFHVAVHLTDDGTYEEIAA